ncbi:MAG: hypothetical protein PUP92_33955 [Rhizonema sp. PD38]|nr:hypothetical protein [Rhizonema sp. PD38]
MRLAVSAFLENAVVYQHKFETSQRNFETIQCSTETNNTRFTAIVTEIRHIRADMLQMQLEVRGLQTENRRILDVLQNRNTEGDS